MPTLNWIGKKAVVEHHQDVPFRLLHEVPDLSVGDTESGNLLIQGDNLEALKALLPYYAGEVKCIYIDPPYNTGNEGWAYNDNVNSPEIRAWLDKVVGKEAEDLSRHDKWLCMMYPRLVLLHELLAEDGSFWMSIDDNEVHHARALLDEIFGANNFVATVIWQKVYSPKNSANYLSEDHDYVLLYAKNKGIWRPNLLPRTAEQDAAYSNPDNDPRGPWKASDLSARNYYSEGTYSITCPSGRVISGPPKGAYWRYSEKKFKDRDADNRIWWGESGDNVPAIKRFLSEVQDGIVPQTLWFYDEVGHTQEAKKELVQICDFDTSGDVFITPKPTRLIRRILQIATGPNDIILDSFAGTATTGHAVLEQNKRDGGNRRFILVEMEDKVAKPISYQRLQRVIEGYPYKGTDRTELLRKKLTVTNFKKADKIVARMDALKEKHQDEYDGFETKIEKEHIVYYGKKKIKEKKEGLGSGFRFFELGEEVFSSEGRIREEVSFQELARHVYFAQTGRPLPTNARIDSPLVGVSGGTAVYLLYDGVMKDIDPDGTGMLTRSLLGKLPAHDGPKAIYGTACLLSKEQLQQQGITFRQIPYDIPTR